jgi:hypothetical protein
MTDVATKATLTPARRRLIELMQEISFGRIENLAVKDGEPDFDSPPQVVREIKFGGENGPRQEMSVEDFALKSQVIEFFAQLDCLGNGTVKSLEIKHGLPFRIILEETVRV